MKVQVGSKEVCNLRITQNFKMTNFFPKIKAYISEASIHKFSPATRNVKDTSVLNMPILQYLNCISWGHQVFNITSNFFKTNPFCILHYIVPRVTHLYSYIERYGDFGILQIDRRAPTDSQTGGIVIENCVVRSVCTGGLVLVYPESSGYR